jgi:hypothetical protein
LREETEGNMKKEYSIANRCQLNNKGGERGKEKVNNEKRKNEI